MIDLGWRMLDRRTWNSVLLPLLVAIKAAAFDEIALVGSDVDSGVHPDNRAADLIATIRHATHTAPVIAFNQGLLGELCVAAGAIGYSTGIGWRERWNTSTRMRDRRVAREPGPRAPRPVYVGKLGRSIPKKTIEVLLNHRTIAPDLPCPSSSACCRDGVAGLLGDARWHALYSRVASLRQLAETDRRFRWNHLRTSAEQGLDLVRRINLLTTREGLTRVDDAALRAVSSCATTMQERRRIRAA